MKIYSKGFSLTELIIVVMGLGILTSISVPLLYGFIEKAEVSVAKRYLRLAVRECQRQLIDGVNNPSFTNPPLNHWGSFQQEDSNSPTVGMMGNA